MLSGADSTVLQVEAAITTHYARSGSFNGLPLVELARRIRVERDQLLTAVEHLIRAGRLSAVFDDAHPNPAIKALPEQPIPEQLAKVAARADSAWLYPTAARLREVVKPGAFRNRPFTKRLARGEHQFEYCAFDPVVLLTYRDDPRYIYHDAHFSGSITIRDEFFDCGRVYKRDEILLKSFGFCFSKTGERFAAGLLCDLSGLSPEHQQGWNNRRLEGDFHLHPAFWHWVCGGWPIGMSVFDAVLQEMRAVNQLSALMGKPPLFRKDFEACPSRFTFLLVPTVDEYNAFVQVLDKVVVENLCEDFFEREIEPFEVRERDDGLLERERKRPISMLREWLGANYTGSETDEVIGTLRKIRRLRNKPSHTLELNAYDPQLRTVQRNLMSEVHEALRLLRMIFQTDRACRHFKLPRFLEDGAKIWLR
jgi:hypothetical protein